MPTKLVKVGNCLINNESNHVDVGNFLQCQIVNYKKKVLPVDYK
jgi:hypothetical protein